MWTPEIDTELARRYSWHPPVDQATITRHEAWRESCRTLAEWLVRELATGGRELSLTLTALEQAQMWGHAAIARPCAPNDQMRL